MTDKPMISIDGEWLLKRIQDLEIIINELRGVASRGAFVQQVPTARDIIKSTNRVYNLEDIDWKVKGMEPFKLGDVWGWAFGYNQDGTVKPETYALIQVIERDGKAIIDGYVIKLGGRDGSLLNRQKVKR